LGEERTEQGQHLGVGIQVEEKGAREVASVGGARLRIASHLKEGANDVESITDIFEGFCFLEGLCVCREK
jgi:hypothetical protein